MQPNKKRTTEYDLRHGVFSKTFLKKHSQVVYAIILIFLIPSVIIGNTLFTINRFGKNIDEQLRRQALVIAELFDTTAFNSLSDVDSVQTSIDRMLEGPDELRSFDVMVPDGGEFKIVASSIPANIDTTVSGTNTLLAWSTDEGIAHLSQPSLEDIRRDSSLAGERFWNVVFPLHDNDGQKIGLLNLKMTLAETDALFKSALIRSTLLLAGTVVIVLGLLLINTKLFQYAVLFRKLEEIDQMKDEFISMASHELRSPITAIKGYVSMFLDGNFGKITDAGTKGLTTIDASIRRLADLVEDLLDVSRIEQQRMKLTVEELQIEEVIEQTLTEFSVSAKGKNLTVIYEKKAIPKVSTDRDKLRQILVNLIGNAIKYTKKGSVTVSAEA
ncbi:MAG: HAMP domain-containing sensor histidine kinase, partial [Patescibacteria group bacterium]